MAVATAARLRSIRGDSLFRESLFLILTTIANSGLGYVFWVIAAHAYSAPEIGAATAVTAAITISGILGDLGFRTLLMHRLPTTPSDSEWSRYLSAALVTCTCCSAFGGLVAWLLVRNISSVVHAYVSGAWPVALVIISVGVTLSLLLDGVATSERRARQALARNALNSLLKALALVTLALGLKADPRSILLATAIGVGISVIFGLLHQVPSTRPGWRLQYSGSRDVLREVRSDLTGHYLLNSAGLLPAYILPLEVLTILGASATAHMSLTWMLGSAFFMISPSVSAVLFAHGSRDVEKINELSRKATLVITALMLPAMVGAIVFGRFVLKIFGTDYAHDGYVLLVVLALSAVPDAITNLEMGRLRASGNVWEGARLNAFMGGLAVVLTWFLVAPMGITGVGVAWFAAQSAGVLYLEVRKRLRRIPRSGEQLKPRDHVDTGQSRTIL